MAAWTPPAQLNAASTKPSSLPEQTIGFKQPVMSPEALREMLERNMGQSLSPVNDWNSK